MSTAQSDHIPLARLLAMAYRQLIDALHERLSECGHSEIRPAYGYVLLALRTAPSTAVEIAALLGVTKQAASKLLETMEAGGYVRREAHSEDARAKQVAITARGRKLLGTVESIYEELEGSWADIIGQRRVDALRADLRRVVEAAHGGVLPPVRPTV